MMARNRQWINMLRQNYSIAQPEAIRHSKITWASVYKTDSRSHLDPCIALQKDVSNLASWFDLNSRDRSRAALLATLLLLGGLGLSDWHSRRSLIVVALLTVTQACVTHKAATVADAIVLPAVVPPAIASLADSLVQGLLLGFSSLHGFFRVVVEAAYAQADTRSAAQTILQADTVELATLAALAVAAAEICGLFRLGVSQFGRDFWNNYVFLQWFLQILKQIKLLCDWIRTSRLEWVLSDHGILNLHLHLHCLFRLRYVGLGYRWDVGDFW